MSKTSNYVAKKVVSTAAGQGTKMAAKSIIGGTALAGTTTGAIIPMVAALAVGSFISSLFDD